jgi:hypothetical protein
LVGFGEGRDMVKASLTLASGLSELTDDFQGLGEWVRSRESRCG